MIYKLCCTLDIFCLQEVRGSGVLVEKYLGKLQDLFIVNSSFCGGNRGGVLTLVRRANVSSVEHITNTEIVSGRVLRTVIHGPLGSQFIYNIHNYDLSYDEVARLGHSIKDDAKIVSSDPLNNSMFALGDLNLANNPKERFQYTSGTATHPGASAHPSGPTRMLGDILTTLVEVRGDLPTHYIKDSDSGTIIDRVFLASPPFLFPLCRWAVEITHDPKELNRCGMSDHTPVIVRIKGQREITKANRPIAPEIFMDPVFATVHDRLCRDANLPSLAYPERLRVHKQIIRDAALLTRERMQDDNELSDPFIYAGRLTTIARIIWTQNTDLARKLLTSSEVANKHLLVSQNGVLLKDPEAFSEEVTKAKDTWYSEQIKKEEKSGGRAKIVSPENCIDFRSFGSTSASSYF